MEEGNGLSDFVNTVSMYTTGFDAPAGRVMLNVTPFGVVVSVSFSSFLEESFAEMKANFSRSASGTTNRMPESFTASSGILEIELNASFTRSRSRMYVFKPD
uniref:Uncharacterized protein n=1 Tax=Anopheles melas TaxID=34690 RepID=A0A182UBH4_9DIPT